MFTTLEKKNRLFVQLGKIGSKVCLSTPSFSIQVNGVVGDCLGVAGHTQDVMYYFSLQIFVLEHKVTLKKGGVELSDEI